eukprot:COSAG05_NODE_725_length_7716_cov_46.424314_7_plen_162_part_00
MDLKADEIREAFTKLAVGKVVDAQKKKSRKSYADIPVMIHGSDDSDADDTDGSARPRLRTAKAGGPSLSERIGSERRGNIAADGGHGLWDTQEGNEHGATVSAALEAATEAADATQRHEKTMKARMETLEKHIDAELRALNNGLSQISKELTRLGRRHPNS